MAAAERYGALAGGADALLEPAREAFERGDRRRVVEVVNHLVSVEGDQARFGELLGLLDPPDPRFAIVTP